MKEKSLPYLNLGCGKKLVDSWINIDMVAIEPKVIVHDLTKKLPYPEGSFKVVYHSHVLEHIPKDKAPNFLQECYRLLEKGGVIRVVVPDLETIARNYIKFLDQNVAKPTEESSLNYDWTMIEMYDQVVRGESGGEMQHFLNRRNPANWEYVKSRSAEARRMEKEDIPPTSFSHKMQKFQRLSFKQQWILVKSMMRDQILGGLLPGKKYFRAGLFRLGGEVHQWMYDRYSLEKVLRECGFQQIEIKTAFESNIPDWTSFDLDAVGDQVLKPDSLFMEAIK